MGLGVGAGAWRTGGGVLQVHLDVGLAVRRTSYSLDAALLPTVMDLLLIDVQLPERLESKLSTSSSDEASI